MCEPFYALFNDDAFSHVARSFDCSYERENDAISINVLKFVVKRDIFTIKINRKCIIYIFYY